MQVSLKSEYLLTRMYLQQGICIHSKVTRSNKTLAHRCARNAAHAMRTQCRARNAAHAMLRTQCCVGPSLYIKEAVSNHWNSNSSFPPTIKARGAPGVIFFAVALESVPPYLMLTFVPLLTRKPHRGISTVHQLGALAGPPKACHGWRELSTG